jgi:DNA polymerase elongation subunit (family B)
MIQIELNGNKFSFDTQNDLELFLSKRKLSTDEDGNIYELKGMGVIPEVLDKWFNERIEFKNLMKKYKNEGNTELAEFYDRRQHIQKIFLNSLYGVLGLPIFRFFDIDNALAVTATGQDVIKNSANFTNNLYQHRLNDTTDHCIYIDTDSLYFSSDLLIPKNKDSKEFTISLSRFVENKLNDHYNDMAKELFFCKNHRFYIKGESVASKGLWIAKKRYALNVVYDLESNLDVDNKVKVKGLDIVRSTFPPAFRDFMKDMLKSILSGISKEEMDELVLVFSKDLTNKHYLEIARNLAVKNISEYERGISNRLNDFLKGTPAHVKAAITYNKLLRYFNLEKQYGKIVDGDKIKYIYLKQNPLNLETVAVKGYNDPVEITDIAEEYVDAKALFDNELKKKLQDFYSALGWGLLPTEVNQKANEFFSF